MCDLRNVLTGLNGVIEENRSSVTQEVIASPEGSQGSDSDMYQCGEHLASVWYDDVDNCFKWYIGVVDGITENKIMVSYMKKVTKRALDGSSLKRLKYWKPVQIKFYSVMYQSRILLQL